MQPDKLRKMHFARRKTYHPRMQWTERLLSELSRNALKLSEQNKNAYANSNCATKKKPRKMPSVKGKSSKEKRIRSQRCLRRLPNPTMTTFASKPRRSALKLLKRFWMYHHL